MTAESKPTAPGPTETPPATPAEQPATPASETAPKTTGAEARIHGLVAEREAAKTKAADLEAKYNDLVNRTQTEEEKARRDYANQEVDKFKVTEYQPVIHERDQYKAIATTQLEMIKQRLPEDKRINATVDAMSLPQQVEFYSALADSITASPQPPSTVGAPLNPALPPGKKLWKLSEIRANQNEPGWWEANREDILRAQGEGRFEKDV
jgi:hypothetical protein